MRVTFDSNVFVSALNYQGPPARLLELAAVDAFRLQLSAEILDETMRILGVSWPVRGGSSALMAPVTSVVTTTERLFVIRVNKGRAEWVDVKRGARDGDQVQVYGNLFEGDTIVLRGSDEIRDGTQVQTTPVKKTS